MEILIIRRLQFSNRRKLVKRVCRQLVVERIRPDIPFHIAGRDEGMIDSELSNWLLQDWPHAAFAIFHTKTGFVIRSLERLGTGGWKEASPPPIEDLFPPDKSDVSWESIADTAAKILRRVLSRQKRLLD